MKLSIIPLALTVGCGSVYTYDDGIRHIPNLCVADVELSTYVEKAAEYWRSEGYEVMVNADAPCLATYYIDLEPVSGGTWNPPEANAEEVHFVERLRDHQGPSLERPAIVTMRDGDRYWPLLTDNQRSKMTAHETGHVLGRWHNDGDPVMVSPMNMQEAKRWDK